MTIHKCDSCGNEMGVWINVNTTIGATRNETNVSYLTPFITSREYCVECAKEKFNISPAAILMNGKSYHAF